MIPEHLINFIKSIEVENNGVHFHAESPFFKSTIYLIKNNYLDFRLKESRLLYEFYLRGGNPNCFLYLKPTFKGLFTLFVYNSNGKLYA